MSTPGSPSGGVSATPNTTSPEKLIKTIAASNPFSRILFSFKDTTLHTSAYVLTTKYAFMIYISITGTMFLNLFTFVKI